MRARAERRLHDRDHERPALRRSPPPPRRRFRSRPARSWPSPRRRRTSTRSAALVLLAGHIAGRGRASRTGIRAGGGALAEALPAFDARADALAVPFAYTGRMFVIGRGVEFATAREIALKLLETCRVAAEPLTATDLAHGPVAALDPFFPVWAIASPDATLPAVQEAALRIHEMGATRRRERHRRGRDRGQPVHAAGPRARRAAALTAPLGRARPALRRGARPRPRPRPGRAARAEQDHARAVNGVASG